MPALNFTTSPAHASATLQIPVYLAEAIEKRPNSFLRHSHPQKRILQRITYTKNQPARERRIATAPEWIAGGMSRNWKYEKKK